MPFSLEGGATFTSGDQADVLDLTSAAATVMLRKSYQPSTVNRNQGFSVCMWFKADQVLSKSQSAYFPLASKFIENKGWELRLTLGGRVSFRVATELGPQFEVAVNVGSADAFSWHHVCGIHYGSSLSKVGILVDGSVFADHYLPVGTAKYMPVTSVRDTRIGRSLGDPRLKFQGMVAGFKVWADKAIAIPSMQHIGGACGGGMNSPSNIAIGAQVNLYQDKEGTGHRLTDSSKVTCAKTFWNRYLPDLNNGKLDSVFAQIDLGQVRKINRVVFELDRVNLPPNWDHLVDVYVGNTGNRNYDTPCAVRANLESSTVVSCRRASIEATSSGTGLVHTGDDTNQRKYSSILSSDYSKGSLTSESGWRPKKDDIAPWTQVMLDGFTEVWGIMLDSCNVANPNNKQMENPSYVTKFTVSYSVTGNEGSFIPVDGGHVFRGLGFLVQEQFRRPFHWDIPVRARFVRVHPVAYNQDICMRFDVLRGPGRAEGRYVTVYAKSRLSLCEIEVYPEVAGGTGGRSAMCTPRLLQSSCLKPEVTDVKYDDLSLTSGTNRTLS
jgi:hypothetical protein